MRYLGVDFGFKRIGLAISEGEIASPYRTLQVKNFQDGLEQVIQTITKENFDKVVVGLPEGKMGQNVSGFVKVLKRSGLDVVTADETLSSQKAIQQMIDSGISRYDRRIADATAAAIILQDYLDSK